MPRLSMLFIRTALVYLAIGFTTGAALLSNKALPFYPSVWKLLPIHIEMLMVGWFVQLAVGVAFWILPRLSSPDPRGSQRAVWLSFWLINIGIGLVCIEALYPLPLLLLLGRSVEVVGVFAFVLGSWERVKGFSK